eukprot:125283_1
MAKLWHRNLDFSKYKQSKRQTFPIIYITGQSIYNGVLQEKETSEEGVWTELIEQQRISELLIKWQKRISNKQDASFTEKQKKKLLKTIIPFRMVLHKTHRMKLSYNYPSQSKQDSASVCKYFVLLWIPCNQENGLNDDEYDEFVKALIKAKYFCNQLNKECIYISGPTYGHDEIQSLSKIGNDAYQNKFDLKPLENYCLAFSAHEIPPDKKLDVQIVVHELNRKKLKREDKEQFEFDIFKNSPRVANVSVLSGDTIDAGPTSFFSQFIPNSKLTYNGLPESQFKVSEISYQHTSTDQLNTWDQSADRENHAFAFVWFRVSDKNVNINSSANQNEKAFVENKLRKTSIADELKQSLIDLDDDPEELKHVETFEMFEIENEEETHVDGILPALSVMYRLHQQPCGDSRAGLINVELMGYDECYQNLNLTVDTYRSGTWKDSFIVMTLLVLVQCLFLPIFVVIPPISIIKCCAPKFKVRPRYRPGGALSDPFEDLDRTEQIPYDISAIWRSYRFDKKYRWTKRCWRKFVSFLLSTLILGIVVGGPVLYRYDSIDRGEVKNLSFFDSFGPAMFYGLWVVTIICWACVPRGLIGPKEHLLLYNKIIAQRPARKQKPSTDFAALTYLSQHSMVTTLSYAQRKNFLEVRTPTHELISRRRFRCGLCCKRKNGSCDFASIKSWLLCITCNIIYFMAQNLENFQEKQQPFYIDPADNHFYLRKAYCIVSNISSWVMLWSFIALWETMIDRISRQHDNVKNITNLIVRNTYSEYIQLDYTDNILSWITLGDFIKRKGMMLFASLETPVFTLFLLAFVSWSGTIFCIFGGVGGRWKTQNSLFSNSALATWFYLAFLSVIQVCRLLWYGHKFNRESEKQNNGIRTQCSTIHNENLMQFLKHDKLSLEQKYAIQSSQILLTHLKDHNEIVPRVFGIKFDKLTAKAFTTVAISTIPTIIGFVVAKIHVQG